MERTQKVYSKADGEIYVEIIPGHFATNHSHVSHYVNMTGVKTNHRMAKSAAGVLAGKLNMTPVDTVICLEGTEVIGAFLADELCNAPMAVSKGNEICVVTPEANANNQIIFRDNTKGMVSGRNVVLLLSSVSTGKTIRRGIDCLNYYDAHLMGIGALFSAAGSVQGVNVYALFTAEELPAYQTAEPGQCGMCAQGMKIDAIVNSYGYSKI